MTSRPMAGKATTSGASGSASPGLVATGRIGPVIDGSAVVVVVVPTAAATAGAVDGHESASARVAPLKLSTVVPTARVMTIPATRDTPRRRTISRSTTPVATRRNARVTSIEMLAPVTGSSQGTPRDATTLVSTQVQGPDPPVWIRVVRPAIGYVTDATDALPAPKGQDTGSMKLSTSPTVGAYSCRTGIGNVGRDDHLIAASGPKLVEVGICPWTARSQPGRGPDGPATAIPADERPPARPTMGA